MSEPAQPAPRPREQLPIALFDGVVIAARAADGRIYLGLRDLCQTLGLDPSSQRRRIAGDESLHLTQLRVLVDRQLRAIDFLLLDDVPLWLLSIQGRRVAPEVRERFGYIKTYLVGAVQQAFAQLVGLPDGPSGAIEELGELDRIDRALGQLAALGERQEALESSQERARGAFRDISRLLHELHARVEDLERQVGARLAPAQRGAVYAMVQRWGAARARAGEIAPGVAMRRCWAELNARFGVSTYTDLPAGQYGAIVQFLKDQYRALTGDELEASEQLGLGGGDAG